MKLVKWKNRELRTCMLLWKDLDMHIECLLWTLYVVCFNLILNNSGRVVVKNFELLFTVFGSDHAGVDWATWVVQSLAIHRFLPFEIRLFLLLNREHLKSKKSMLLFSNTQKRKQSFSVLAFYFSYNLGTVEHINLVMLAYKICPAILLVLFCYVFIIAHPTNSGTSLYI